ncbi:MAG: type II toxin-antitoxin system PemK/MazF family toxin [Gemmatimonadota bacterium]
MEAAAARASVRPLRSEIWEFDLNPKRGREQRGVRPCLIVSTNSLNESTFGTVIVCPITTRKRPSFRWRPGLMPEDLTVIDQTWKALPNWVATDQIVTADAATRGLRHLATVENDEKMRAVENSLRMLLDL